MHSAACQQLFLTPNVWGFRYNGLNFSGIPMEVFLILIHIVLFSSDNLDPFQSLVHKQNIENIQTEYMLFLHRLVRKAM